MTRQDSVSPLPGKRSHVQPCRAHTMKPLTSASTGQRLGCSKECLVSAVSHALLARPGLTHMYLVTTGVGPPDTTWTATSTPRAGSARLSAQFGAAPGRSQSEDQVDLSRRLRRGVIERWGAFRSRLQPVCCAAVSVRASHVGRAGYWGFTVGDGAGAWVLGVGAPLLAAVVWGALVAPNARWPVPIPTRVAIELVLFGAAAGRPRGRWSAAGCRGLSTPPAVTPRRADPLPADVAGAPAGGLAV
jgi:hypothetical protein